MFLLQSQPGFRPRVKKRSVLKDPGSNNNQNFAFLPDGPGTAKEKAENWYIPQNRNLGFDFLIMALDKSAENDTFPIFNPGHGADATAADDR